MDNLNVLSKTVSKIVSGDLAVNVHTPKEHNNSFIIKDLIITGNISLSLDDGINNVIIGNFTDNFSHSFNGMLHTWTGASLTAMGQGTVLMVFIPTNKSKSFDEWTRGT